MTSLQVNRPTTRLGKPNVRITGRRVIDGVIQPVDDYVPNRNDQEPVQDGGMDQTKAAVIIFYADGNDYPIITLTPDNKFATNTYGLDRDESYDGNQIGERAFQGPQGMTGNSLGLSSDTYYTINGKIPRRSKGNLYHKPFTIRRNVTGSDNVILKARTYRAGVWSDIRTIEFRVVRNDDTRV